MRIAFFVQGSPETNENRVFRTSFQANQVRKTAEDGKYFAPFVQKTAEYGKEYKANLVRKTAEYGKEYKANLVRKTHKLFWHSTINCRKIGLSYYPHQRALWRGTFLLFIND
ncbi:MAG: hypothetical protein DRR19_05595 [Candidatus Parabeggiatoa sp. nov. 1]|nr:MAG: hypothetical protein DRR19_05595 [Gammaproteobacteria bacterium]